MAWEEFVLGGVGGAIVAGGIGTFTAVRIDRLTAQRDRKRQEDTEHAISRLLCSELAAAYETVERALGAHRWPLWQPPLGRQIWDRHAHTFAPAIDNALVDQLARTYDVLAVWQSRVSLYLAQFPANSWMNLSGELPEERESAELLNSLRKNLETSRRELEAIGHYTPRPPL